MQPHHLGIKSDPYGQWWVDGWDETSKWYFESRTSLQLCGNFALATTSLLAATGARLGWRCLAAVATPDYMHRAAKWLLTTNKNLPKFTPIFLILPQTLVVCQNWLASNLEKDILRKCQKCRRMEDNSDCCSLVWPGPGSFQIHKLSLASERFFHAGPSKIYNFWWAQAIFG